MGATTKSARRAPLDVAHKRRTSIWVYAFQGVAPVGCMNFRAHTLAFVLDDQVGSMQPSKVPRPATQHDLGDVFVEMTVSSKQRRLSQAILSNVRRL